MIVSVLVREDAEYMTWTQFVDVLNKDDPDFFDIVLKITKEQYPYIFKDEDEELHIEYKKNYGGLPKMDGWVFTTYKLRGKTYRHYLFGIIEK